MKNAKNTKTKIKLLRPDEVWQPHRGARPGNSNALKTGLHTAEVRDLRRRLRAFHARVKAMVKQVDERLKNSPSPSSPGRHHPARPGDPFGSGKLDRPHESGR